MWSFINLLINGSGRPRLVYAINLLKKKIDFVTLL